MSNVTPSTHSMIVCMAVPGFSTARVSLSGDEHEALDAPEMRKSYARSQYVFT